MRNQWRVTSDEIEPRLAGLHTRHLSLATFHRFLEEWEMRNLFWAYAVVWLLHIGYLLSLAVRQNGLRREIATLKALIEQKGQTLVGR